VLCFGHSFTYQFKILEKFGKHKISSTLIFVDLNYCIIYNLLTLELVVFDNCSFLLFVEFNICQHSYVSRMYNLSTLLLVDFIIMSILKVTTLIFSQLRKSFNDIFFTNDFSTGFGLVKFNTAFLFIEPRYKVLTSIKRKLLFF
jgi:hypothetical protein